MWGFLTCRVSELHRESCGSIWSKVIRGTHEASGVADLTQLSLGTSITFLCVAPCRSFCYQEGYSPVSVLAPHYFQHNFSSMSSCWLTRKHQQRRQNCLCWWWMESRNMQFTQKHASNPDLTPYHTSVTAAAHLSLYTHKVTPHMNSFAALQFCMWVTVCSCMERNNISRAPEQCRGLGMCCLLHILVSTSWLSVSQAW